jgi:hypothetical protein
MGAPGALPRAARERSGARVIGMLRCPRCDRIFEDEGEGPAACEVCGAALVREAHEPPPSAPPPARPTYTELVKIYEARSEPDLELVRAILSGGGIPAFAFGEHIRATRPSFDAPRAVLIPVEFAARAADVLHQQGVIPGGVVEAADLERLWVGVVAPLLAAPHAAALAAEVGRRDAALRAALFADLERAGSRGLALLADLALALALRGPDAAAREAASHLAAAEAFRERRADLVLALGALVRRSSAADLAGRVAGMLERFRGSIEAERALVPLLDHDDAAVRDGAIEALYSVSGGETLGFEPEAPPQDRALAVARWWARLGGRA